MAGAGAAGAQAEAGGIPAAAAERSADREGSGEERGPEGQMSLFGAALAEAPRSGLSAAQQSVLRDLKRKNILKLTPLDALNYLYRLQERLEEE